MKDASDVRTMLVDSATRLFADHVDSKMLDAAKRDGWSPALWQIVEDAQLALVSVPEEAGGAGGTLGSRRGAAYRRQRRGTSSARRDRYRRLDACRSGP